VQASCQCETGKKFARFEPGLSCLNARQVLKTGDKKVFRTKARKKESCYEEGPFRGACKSLRVFAIFELTGRSLDFLAFFAKKCGYQVGQRASAKCGIPVRPGL
jgi:hypothetical protein